MKKIVLALLLVLPSCVNLKPLPVVESPKTELSVFPLKPNIVEYTRKPVIDAQDNNFVVSDEFVKNSLLYKKWTENIEKWTKLNNIK
jgi:hypothetical protein